MKTRRERLRWALYLRLKKRKVFEIVKGDPFDFLKIQLVANYQKKLKRGRPFGRQKKSKKKRKVRILKQSHSAEILKRGDPLGFLALQFAAKYQKTWWGTLWRQKKFEKIAVPKKIGRGDPSVSSAYANARKSFWLKQGLEPVTAGFSVHRLKSVLKSGAHTMRSVVW